MNCELVYNTPINDEIFRLDFVWQATKLEVPKAGQFFMVKPKRGAVFLARPISVAMWENNTVTFFIARCGKGTQELAAMQSGEEAELIGPLGNAWIDFLPSAKERDKKRIALVGGGIGFAPLNALLVENLVYQLDLYIGFRTGFNKKEKSKLLARANHEANNVIIATEDGTDGFKGRIPDFLEPEKYAAVCACGPEPMLKAVAAKCGASEGRQVPGVPCFISMERRMACGVGACLGCTVRTVNGNRRCCADGSVFKAEELIFDE